MWQNGIDHFMVANREESLGWGQGMLLKACHRWAASKPGFKQLPKLSSNYKPINRASHIPVNTKFTFLTIALYTILSAHEYRGKSLTFKI